MRAAWLLVVLLGVVAVAAQEEVQADVALLPTPTTNQAPPLLQPKGLEEGVEEDVDEEEEEGEQVVNEEEQVEEEVRDEVGDEVEDDLGDEVERVVKEVSESPLRLEFNTSTAEPPVVHDAEVLEEVKVGKPHNLTATNVTATSMQLSWAMKTSYNNIRYVCSPYQAAPGLLSPV